MSPLMPTRLFATLIIILFAGMLLPFPDQDWQAEAAGGKESPRFGFKGLPVWDPLVGNDGTIPAGEPTLGISWQTDVITFQAHSTTYGVEITEGADPGLDPATALWTDLENEVSITNVDPMLHTDPITGRIWAGGLNGQGSVMGVSDDNGETWVLQYPNNGGSQFDHQTLGSGPWAVPKPLAANGAGEDRATYYCAQLPNMKCGVSYDGGTSWLPTGEIPAGCGGLHGHVRVTENGPMQGWAYVPNKKCNSRTGFAVTEDNGQTWSIRTATQSKGNGFFDPSIGITQDSGWIYFGQSERQGAWIGLSKDGGKNWEDVGQGHGAPDGTKWFDVGELVGVKRAMFADVQAGDDLRAAFAFLGSETDAPPDTCGPASSAHVWYYYIAITYDGGQTWNAQKMWDDPVQMGGIWPGGGGDPCRNLLDFNDMDIDRKGRIYVAFADGCLDCTDDQSSRSKAASILRQRTGCGLFQEFDVDPSNPFCLSNSLPILIDIGDKVIPVGDTLHFEVKATDPDNDEVRYKFSDDNFPMGADISFGEKSGAFIWNTKLGEQGTYSVKFTAFEHLSPPSQDSETITIIVTPPNPPVAVDDAFEVHEDVEMSLDILANDSDADNDLFVLESFGVSERGVTLIRNSMGTPAAHDDQLLYTAPADFNGEDRFTYTIFDGKWGRSTATVSIDVLPTNDPPTAVADSYVFAPGSPPVQLFVMDNDDIFPDSNEALFIAGVTDAMYGTVSVASNSMWLEYTPASTIGVDSFFYTLSDSSGATADAKVQVRITDRNPDIQADFIFEPVEGTIIGEEVPVQFSDLSSDTVGIIAWHWDFGDGATTATQHPVHAYSQRGSYDVTLTVWGNGGEDQVTKTIEVIDLPPVVDFELLDKQPQAGKSMGFVDRSIDKDGSISAFYWDFDGDGQPDATGPNVNWMFSEAGYYEVTLVVVDDAGNQASITKTFGLGGQNTKEGSQYAGGPSGGGAGYNPPWFEDKSIPPTYSESLPEPNGNETEEQTSEPVRQESNEVQVHAPTTTESTWPAWATGLAVGLSIIILGLLVVLLLLRRT